MSTRQRTDENDQPADGRERILMAALRLFGERGFSGASVRDIAAEAGVSLGLIRHHFGSKEGVREALDRQVIARFAALLDEYASREVSNPLKAMGGDILQRSIEDPERTRAGFSYMRRTVFEGGDVAREYVRTYRDKYAALVRRAVDSGAWRDDLDEDMVTFLIMARDFGEIFLWRYGEELFGESMLSRPFYERLVAVENDMLERGIAAEDDR
jgi:AcrR family transcriptional regulator